MNYRDCPGSSFFVQILPISRRMKKFFSKKVKPRNLVVDISSEDLKKGGNNKSFRVR